MPLCWASPRSAGCPLSSSGRSSCSPSAWAVSCTTGTCHPPGHAAKRPTLAHHSCKQCSVMFQCDNDKGQSPRGLFLQLSCSCPAVDIYKAVTALSLAAWHHTGAGVCLHQTCIIQVQEYWLYCLLVQLCDNIAISLVHLLFGLWA